MQTSYRDILKKSFEEVLEKFSFMFGEISTKEELVKSLQIIQAEGHEFMQAQAEMSFSGTINGKLILIVPSAMCLEIATNALGVELDGTNEKECAKDALKELLNITCGQLLLGIAGKEPAFNLSIPETTIIDQETWKAFINDEEIIVFMVEDYPTLLKLEISQ